MTMGGDDYRFGFLWECVLAAAAGIGIAVAATTAALFLA